MSGPQVFKRAETSRYIPHLILRTGVKTSHQLPINAMKLFIVIPLLFLLSDAAPLADDQALSHPLQKREYLCDRRWGRYIANSDCKKAWQKMWGLVGPRDKTKPTTREAKASLYQVPKRRTVGSCTIIVDQIDRAATLPTSWRAVAGNGYDLIDQCVVKSHTGGQTDAHGFKTIVYKDSVEVAAYVASQRQSSSNAVARALEHISGPLSLP